MAFRWIAVGPFIFGLIALLLASFFAAASQMMPLAAAGVFSLLVSVLAAIYSWAHWTSRAALVASVLILVWMVVTLKVFFVVGK
jgi:hypothetical protein